MELLLNNIWIVAFLPLWACLIITLGKNYIEKTNKKIAMYITAGVTFVGLLLSLIALFYCSKNSGTSIENNFVWLGVGQLRFSIGWLVDNLSSMMLCVVTSVSLLIQIYSHAYMEEDSCYNRFFAYLAFFNFAMLGLVLSTNLFQTYIFWELVGVASYLLIGFWYKKKSAALAAQKAFIVNRIGDFGLLVGTIGFLFLSFNYWIYESNTLLSFSNINFAAEIALISSGSGAFTFFAAMMFLGPVAKSAQFPLHVWLPDAMEGPTPISALIHAATMVAAGIYLVARLYPIFELSPLLMSIIAWTGVLTAIIGASIAIVQYDIKKILAYSTISQLGFMFMAMGVGSYSAGLFHLMTHAYFKAMLFLCSGAIIHALAGQQDIRYMGGLRKTMPVAAYTFLIGALSISGLFLSGFFSKEQILSGVFESGTPLMFNLALIAAALTSFYMFRVYFLTFEGDYKGHMAIHKPSKYMTIPLIVLAVPSALFGLFFNDSFSSFINNGHNLHQHFMFLPVISIIIAALGLGLAAIMYYEEVKLFSASIIIKRIQPFYRFVYNKWCIDIFYEKVLCRTFDFVARCFNSFDKYIIDGFINLLTKLSEAVSIIFNIPQQKTIGTYIAISAFAIVGLCIFALSIWYSLVT